MSLAHNGANVDETGKPFVCGLSPDCQLCHFASTNMAWLATTTTTEAMTGSTTSATARTTLTAEEPFMTTATAST